MAVQKWNGLTRDGVAGPRTRAALRAARRPATDRAGRRVDVLIDRQVALLVDRRGVVRRTISVSTGAPGYDTPRGSFRVNRKERNSWSVPYKVWLPYASCFNAGIALPRCPRTRRPTAACASRSRSPRRSTPSPPVTPESASSDAATRP